MKPHVVCRSFFFSFCSQPAQLANVIFKQDAQRSRWWWRDLCFRMCVELQKKKTKEARDKKKAEKARWSHFMGLEWHSVARSMPAYISLIKLKLFDEWNFNVPHFRFFVSCPRACWFTIDENWIFRNYFWLTRCWVSRTEKKSNKVKQQPSISRNSWPCPS